MGDPNSHRVAPVPGHAWVFSQFIFTGKRMSRIKGWGVAAGVLVLAAASAATYQMVGVRKASEAAGGSRVAAAPAASFGRQAGTPETAAKAAVGGQRGTFIVLLKEDALATYQGGRTGLVAPQRTLDRLGKLRLDTKSAAARNYVDYLEGRQIAVQSSLERAIGRPLAVRDRMQHAVNGMVVDMTEAEAATVARNADVRLVEAYREYPLDTDVGPGLIGAPAVWNGTAAGSPYQGEGVVVGILDTGINFGSPSFAAVDPIDGYQHVNPRGAGNYLGTCAAGQVDAGRCNDKLIGGYDFICGAPGNACSDATLREEPGFGDTNSHGSHVASTSAGNRRDAQFRGATVRISGVAPRANIVAFDICYTVIATGQGSCPSVSAVAAINQAIADGVVDVLNYSIGGGTSPWGESVSLAFLSAVQSGIYVAASAGNSGPGPNTMGHLQPWVTSTAASQHGRGDFIFALSVTGPGTVPAVLGSIPVNEGGGGVAHTSAIPGTTPVRVSPNIDATNDGCTAGTAYPANFFAGAIAVVRRGTCAFTEKVANAGAAGAVAVVIANNQAGAIAPTVTGATIRAFGILQSDGNALRDFAAGNGNTTTGGINYPAASIPNTADALASFSSRGPAGTFDLLKPDVTAPGVNILAVVAGTTITGSENAVGLLSGTSMASPHQAGAAALVRQVRGSWSVPEIRSALAMTADETVLLEDQVTPANAFAAGAGRIRVDRAVAAGLVLDETAARYNAANPATGGDPASLNQPSMARRSCFQSCEFVRTFRNTLPGAQAYHVRLEGLVGRVSPATLKVAAGGSASLRITIDSSQIAANGAFSFGKVVLVPASPRGSTAPILHLPVAVAVQPPSITFSGFTGTARTGATGTVPGSIGNAGGSTLAYTVDNSGTGSYLIGNAPRGSVNSGFTSSFLTDNATQFFAADDFTLPATTSVSQVNVEGFILPSASLAAVTNQLTWSIYADANGMPAGNPQTSPGVAVWRYQAAPGSAGVSIVNAGQLNDIRLNLAQAGQAVSLPAGRYWLVVNPRTTTANRWIWFGSSQATGGFMTIGVAANGTGAWTANTTFGGLAMRIDGVAQCGAPWMQAVTPSVGSLLPGTSRATNISVTAAGLSPGSYGAYLCASSNDPSKPRAAGPVRLTVGN